MKKFKNLYFVLYTVIIFVAILLAIILTSPEIKDKFEKNNSSAENVKPEGTNPEGTKPEGTEPEETEFELKAATTYTIITNSKLIFNQDYYNCNKDVDVCLDSSNTAVTFAENTFCSNLTGVYLINFKVNENVLATITITVVESEVDTNVNLKDNFDLSSLANNNSIVKLSNNNFANNNNILTANKSGSTEVSIETELDGFATYIQIYNFSVKPIIKIFDENYVSMSSNAINVTMVNSGDVFAGMFYVQIETDLSNEIPYDLDFNCLNDKISFAENYGIVDITATEEVDTSLPCSLTLTVTANGSSNSITFDLNFLAE